MPTTEGRDSTWLMAMLACVLLMPSIGINGPVEVMLVGQIGAALLVLAALAGAGASSRAPRLAWATVAVLIWLRLGGEALALLEDVRLSSVVAGLLVAGVASGAGIALLLAGRPGRGSLALGAAAVASLCVGVLALHMPNEIDVYVYLRDGSAALLRGTDPYTLTFLSPFSAAENEVFFGPGVLEGGTILFGFPYPPVALLFVTLSSLLGDPRALFAAVPVVAGLLLARRTADVRAGVVLMLLPGLAFVLVQGWVEPVSILLLAVVVATADRRPLVAAIALGLLLVSKQYFVVALPLVWLLLPGGLRSREARRFLATGALAAATTLLPFVVWHPEALWRSVVEFHLRQPFRGDSTSLVVWLVDHTGWPDPRLLGVGSLVAGLLVALALARWAPRTPAGFCLSLALTLLVLFSLSKQAFANYWFLVEAAIVMGAGLSRASAPEREPAIDGEG